MIFGSISPYQMAPLHLAARSGRVKILDYLVEQGADINIQDNNGVILCHTNAGRLTDYSAVSLFPAV